MSPHSSLRRPRRGSFGKLERQWSQPNLRLRPTSGAGGSVSAMSRRLPRTPTQPPGTIIVIENVLPADAATTTVNQQQQTHNKGHSLVKPKILLPHTSKKTSKEQNLCLRVVTMQGFEHQNKISKRVWNRFNNHTKKVLVQNLKRLYDAYHYNTDSNDTK